MKNLRENDWEPLFRVASRAAQPAGRRSSAEHAGAAARGFAVFVSQPCGPGGSAPDLKTFWRGVRKRAQLGDLRVHDLRHSFASFLINRGVPLAAIGQLLGHTRTQTAERYAHLLDETLQVATGQMSEVMNPQGASPPAQYEPRNVGKGE